MARKARKYCMNVTEATACGLGSVGEALTCSLLTTFTTTVNGTVCTYPTLTTEQLQSLPTLEYDERVLSFLDYLEVGNTTIKDSLFTEATFDDPNCEDLFCLLNENFLVYRFLDGIRVVNVGYANGVVQYRAYPENADPNNYSWQNNGTFLNNINLNLVYIIEIRDWFNNEEVCRYTQRVSLPSLIPSTTVTLSPTIARLYEITHGEYSGAAGNYDFRTGCFQIDPSLTIGEEINISYSAINCFLGESYSVGCTCVELTCRPNGCINFEPLQCYTNNCASPVNNNFTISCGDVVCYTVYSCVAHGSYGASANASLNMTAANGMGTVLATIDTNNCCSAVQTSDEYLDVVVSLESNVYSQPQTNYSAVTGCICFTPEIPTNYYVDVEFSAITQTTNNGTSCIRLYTGCTPSIYGFVCEVNSLCSQPQMPVLRVRGGTYAHYRATVGASPVGSTACAKLCLHDAAGSFGISPTITPSGCKCVCVDVEHAPEDVTFYLCNNYSDGQCSVGYLNTSIPIPTNEYAVVCFGVGFVLGVTDPNAGENCVTFYKMAAGETTYSSFCTINGPSVGVCSMAFIQMCGGDSIRYNIASYNYLDPVGACIQMNGFVTSTSGIIPYVDAYKYFDYAGTVAV